MRMKLLFTMDAGNYTEDMPLVERHGIRAMIRRGKLWAMQFAEGEEYKIPGGGKEGTETDLETLKREVLEETGLTVIEASVREIGEVLEKRRDAFNASQRYIAHSRFYACEVEEGQSELALTPSEIAKGYHPVWVDLDTAIAYNERIPREQYVQRDTRFLRWLREHEEEYL